jgi:hypothetical protein
MVLSLWFKGVFPSLRSFRRFWRLLNFSINGITERESALWINEEEDGVMKKLMMVLVASVLAFGAAQSASATTYDLNTIVPGTTVGINGSVGPGATSLNDTLNFSLASVQTALVGSFTDLFHYVGNVDISSFSLDLFSTGDPSTSLGHFADPAGIAVAFSYLNLAAGDYLFHLTGGIASGANGGFYQYRFEVSEVPLPPALLLFATALGGMGLLGYRRRNMRA